MDMNDSLEEPKRPDGKPNAYHVWPRPRDRVRFLLPGGLTRSFAYDDLWTVDVQADQGQCVAYFTTATVTVQGKGVPLLAEYLDEKRLRYLRMRHVHAAEADAEPVYIDAIAFAPPNPAAIALPPGSARPDGQAEPSRVTTRRRA